MRGSGLGFKVYSLGSRVGFMGFAVLCFRVEL